MRLTFAHLAGFIVTGGAGAIGGGVARGIIAKGGWVVCLDVVSMDKGAAIVKSYGKVDR